MVAVRSSVDAMVTSGRCSVPAAVVADKVTRIIARKAHKLSALDQHNDHRAQKHDRTVLKRVYHRDRPVRMRDHPVRMCTDRTVNQLTIETRWITRD